MLITILPVLRINISTKNNPLIPNMREGCVATKTLNRKGSKILKNGRAMSERL